MAKLLAQLTSQASRSVPFLTCLHTWLLPQEGEGRRGRHDLSQVQFLPFTGVSSLALTETVLTPSPDGDGALCPAGLSRQPAPHPTPLSRNSADAAGNAPGGQDLGTGVEGPF